MSDKRLVVLHEKSRSTDELRVAYCKDRCYIWRYGMSFMTINSAWIFPQGFADDIAGVMEDPILWSPSSDTLIRL